MAISPLFWNNGWSLQLSLPRIALDSLIPLMHCATRHVGVKKAFRHFRNVVEGLWLYPTVYSTEKPDQSKPCFSPLLSIVKQRQQSND